MAQRRGPWQVVSRQQVYDNRWIRLTHHEVINPAGQPGIYGTIHFKNQGIGVVPVDGEMHTYLVGQYRFALDAYSWEIPEGGGLVGTDPQAAAAPEPSEELRVQRLPLVEAFAMVEAGEIRDALSILTLQAIELLHLKDRLRPLLAT